MHRSILRFSLLTICFLSLSAGAFAQKKTLDHSVYDSWKSVSGTKLTTDGNWIAYAIQPQEGDNTVEVKNLGTGKVHTFSRGSNFQFSRDGRYLVSTIVPPLADTKKARRDKVKPEDQPKNSLLILNLETGDKTELPRITSYTLPEEDSGWILYRPEPPKAEPPKPGEATKPAETKPAEGEKKQEPEKPKKKTDHRPGDTWVLRNLASGAEEKIEFVTSSRFSKDGSVLAYTLSTKDGEGDGIVYYDLKKNQRKTVVKALGKYPRLAMTEDAKRLAYATDKDDYAAKKPALSIYMWEPGNEKTTLVAKNGSAGIPQDWVVAETGTLTLSDKGNRIFFSTVPKPEEEKKDETPEDEKVNVDIWNWKDTQLQPQQLLQATAERGRTYRAVYHVNGGKIVQLENPEMPSVTVGVKNEGDFGLARVDAAYRRQSSWDMSSGPLADYYLVDVRSGKASRVLSGVRGFFGFSPTGKYVFGFNEVTGQYLAIDPKNLKQVVASAGIPFSIVDELHDSPSEPGAYGTAGWTKGDEHVLIYDNFDIWMVDPTGRQKPVNATDGFGRSSKIRLRYVNTDPELEHVPLNEQVLLSATHDETKADGFYWEKFGVSSAPQRLFMEDRAYSNPTKAKNGDRIFFTRQTMVEYPNVWVADSLSFSNPRQISDANPQQKEYWWLTAERVKYTSLDGTELQGILIKPENFDPSKKYPMIAYFYERDSDTLHQYRSPAPSASTINLPIFASNGYVIFIPDIPYKVGYPGESAINAIVPGVQEVIRMGFVDPKRVGIQGQSWGGYQVTYMITESNMFAAACAGAPVSNMFSAYGGIRWGSGLVRQFQYERTQSRIGGTIWEKPLRFLENSPVFFADKVTTPLLIMHNDKDGAVPWWQGIEMFTALRRLDKPSWLVVYNGEDHNLMQRHNRKDWSIRMQQFFDHYLKGEPMPVWMHEGVPATKKGKDYGFDLVKPGNGSASGGEKKGG